MSAKQCLRHDWLRDAPTQASPHLRRYLSKSREVLLERVVSRENLRRAALLSQATSHANLSESSQNHGLGGSLSQSEMCLSYSLTGSRGSLTGSDCYMSPADSRTSLNSSQTSLATSQASLATSHSYLLNKEQTQGLLSQAQSRSQANLNHVTRRGLLSRMRSLNQIQSQACLSNMSGKMTLLKDEMNTMFGRRSQEKLYGLRCLSKSQGVLDIYRSLECLRNKKRRKKDQRAVTEDMSTIFKKLGNEMSSSSASVDRWENGSETDRRVSDGATRLDVPEDETATRIGGSLQRLDVVETANSPEDPDTFQTSDERKPADVESSIEKMKDDVKEETTVDDLTANIDAKSNGDPTSCEYVEVPKSEKSESEENLDSLQSVESDTLTEDSDETPLDRSLLSVKQPSKRQNSDISSHSNNSGNSDEKDEHSESENEEPKYSVAQLVSAFNKHQEVASKTSLEAIMTEKRVNEVTFPTGPKALRLFIPDINITERGIVRRKTSYKPRKNWEELRKQNEKNEGVLKDFDNDSGNEEADEEIEAVENSENSGSREELRKISTVENPFGAEEIDAAWLNSADSSADNDAPSSLDTRIDEKYKQCVDGARSSSLVDESAKKEEPISTCIRREKERLPNYIFSDVTDVSSRANSRFGRSRRTNVKSSVEPRSDSSVNLKDILQKIDGAQRTSKENLEKLRKRTSITKIMLNDNMSTDNDSNNNNGLAGTANRAKSEPPLVNVTTLDVDQVKLDIPPSFVRSSSLSSESSCPTPSSVQSDIGLSWEDVHGIQGSSTSLEKDDGKVSAKRGQPVWETSRPEAPRTMTSMDNRAELSRTKPSTMSPEERRVWGRVWGKVCTGSYTRAMEKFNGKQSADAVRKSNVNLLNIPNISEKTRRKSSPAMPQYADS